MTISDSRPEPKPARRTSGARLLPRWVRPAAFSLAAALVLLAPLWGPLILRHLDFFRVRNVEVVGARYVEPRDLVERLRIDTAASVWDPTERLEGLVAEHPLVREVEVRRRLPGTLVVRLVEHVPVALVPGAGGFRAYDVRGVALPIDLAAAAVDAPILARPDSAILHLLSDARSQAPALYRRMSEVRQAASGELLMVLDSLPIRTPVGVTLHRLADLEPVEQDLARRGLRPIELDLRFRDQVIARLP